MQWKRTPAIRLLLVNLRTKLKKFLRYKNAKCTWCPRLTPPKKCTTRPMKRLWVTTYKHEYLLIWKKYFEKRRLHDSLAGNSHFYWGASSVLLDQLLAEKEMSLFSLGDYRIFAGFVFRLLSEHGKMGGEVSGVAEAAFGSPWAHFRTFPLTFLPSFASSLPFIIQSVSSCSFIPHFDLCHSSFGFCSCS